MTVVTELNPSQSVTCPAKPNPSNPFLPYPPANPFFNPPVKILIHPSVLPCACSEQRLQRVRGAAGRAGRGAVLPPQRGGRPVPAVHEWVRRTALRTKRRENCQVSCRLYFFGGNGRAYGVQREQLFATCAPQDLCGERSSRGGNVQIPPTRSK